MYNDDDNENDRGRMFGKDYDTDIENGKINHTDCSNDNVLDAGGDGDVDDNESDHDIDDVPGNDIDNGKNNTGGTKNKR